MKTRRTRMTVKTFDIDTDKRALIPEIIAQQATPDPDMQEYLCARARHHWRSSPGFRRSFRRKDERNVLAMWFDHWIKSRTTRRTRMTP